MPVTDVKEKNKGTGAGWSNTGEPGAGTADVTRAFTVTMTADTSNLEIEQHEDIPQRRQGHPFNPFYRCSNLRVKRISPIFAEVEAQYQIPSGSDGDAGGDPLAAPPKVVYGTIYSEGEVDEDINGNPIVTANDEPIRGIRKPFADLSVRITRNVLLFNPVNIYIFSNTINSAEFLGFPAGTAKMNFLGASNVVDEDLAYWEMTAEIIFRKPINTTEDKAWYRRVRHEGFMIRDPAQLLGDTPFHATDAHGEPVVKPVLIDSDGEVITDPANTEWLEWEIFESTNFNDLGLLN